MINRLIKILSNIKAKLTHPDLQEVEQTFALHVESRH